MFFLVAGTFRGEEGRQGIDKGGSGGGEDNKKPPQYSHVPHARHRAGSQR